MLSFAKAIRIPTAALFIVLLVFAPAGNALAASKSTTKGITVSPPIKQVILGPGLLKAYMSVVVTNNTNYKYTATIKLLDFTSLSQNGGVSLEQAGSKFGLANWLSLPSGNSLSLNPGQTITVPVVIDNRSDLTPGGHYGAVSFNTSQPGASNTNVSFNQQLVSLVFANKVDGDNFGLKLQSISPDFGSSGLPNDVTTGFKSTGNVYVAPHGYIEVLDPREKLVERGILNQQDTLIMQGTSRQFITLLQPIQNSSLTGKYKIVVFYRYDNQPKFQTQTYYFNVKTGIVSYIGDALILIILFVSGMWIRRYRLKRVKRRPH